MNGICVGFGSSSSSDCDSEIKASEQVTERQLVRLEEGVRRLWESV